MNLTELLTENWAWLAAIALIAGLFWIGRSRGRSSASGVEQSARTGEARPHDEHETMGAGGAIEPMLTAADAQSPGPAHHGSSGGRRRHGCC